MAGDILNLNDDCLLEVFELLDIDDWINIAETCKRFSGIMNDVFRKKCSSLKYTSAMQDENFAERLLFHVGKYLTNLSFGHEDKSGHFLTKATSHASHLKTLFFRHWELFPKIFQFNSTNFQHIESLSMKQCNLRLNGDFFATFSNIENLNLCYCRGIHNRSLKKFFEKNEKIKSFTFHCRSFTEFPLGSLALLPKLERLYFLGLVKSAEYLEQLTLLKSLTCLKLSTHHLNRNNFSRALLKLDHLKELEINNFSIEEDVFVALKNFHRLSLFSLTFPKIFMWKWKPTFLLPPNIEYLKLEGMYITTRQIAFIINELPKLKQFYINPRAIFGDNDHSKIQDFNEIVRLISGTLNKDDRIRLRILDVTLMNAEYSAEVCCIV